MSASFVIIQLSDPHIGADWGNGNPIKGLSAAVAAVGALGSRPDAVLISGDLADHASDAEYEQVKSLLSPLDAPLYVLPGNHDDRDALHRHFGVPGANEEPVQYSADLGSLRLVVLDSTRPGQDRGELDAQRLAWLKDALAAAPTTPTLLAMHHTPVRTGIPVIDEVGLPDADRRALGQVVEAHPQILRIVGGHVHRTMMATLGGRSVLAVPSTYVQGRLSFAMTEIELSSEPCGFAVHTLRDGELVSHVVAVA
jgi:Icc protein